MKRLSILAVVVGVALALHVPEAHAAAYSSSQSGPWNDPQTWGNAGVPGVADTATINGGHLVTVTDARSVSSVALSTGAATAQLTVDSSLAVSGNVAFSGPANACVLQVNSGRTLAIGGDLPGTGTASFASDSTVEFTGGAGAQSAGGYTYGNFVVNKATGQVNFSGAPTINGNLTVTSGTLYDQGNQISLNGSGTSQVAIGGTGKLALGAIASATAFPGPRAGTTINTGGVVAYVSALSQAIEAVQYQELHLQTLGGAVTHTVTSGTFDVNGNLTITNNGVNAVTLSINSATLNVYGSILGDGDVYVGSSGNLNLAGSYSNTGSLLTDTSPASNATVTYKGTSNQSVKAATGSYNILAVNKSANTATLQSSVNVAKSLNLISGQFNTGSQPLVVSGNIDIDNGATFTLAGSTTSVTGNIVNDGAVMYAAPATLNFNGATPQVYSGGGSDALPNVTISNNTGVTFTNDVTVFGVLALQGGVVQVQSGLEIFVDVNGGVTRSAGFVQGKLTIGFAPSQSRVFHVGNQAPTPAYAPVTITTPAGQSGAITVEVSGLAHPQRTGVDTTDRFWTISSAAVTTADVVLDYSNVPFSGLESSLIAGRYNGAWFHPVVTVDGVANTVTALNANPFAGAWVIGLPGSVGAASTLAVTGLNGGGSINQSSPFTLDVEARADDGSAAPVRANTTLTLTVATGTGAVGGTTSDTMTAGTSSKTISGITYDTAESGVSLNVAASGGDTLTSATTAAFTVVALPTADVGVAASAPATASVNDTIQYLFAITNSGPDAAPSISVSIPMPASLQYLGTTSDVTSSCNVTGSTLTCNLSDPMPSSGSGNLTVSVKVLAGGSHTLAATLTSGATDNGFVNNYSEATVNVAASTLTVTSDQDFGSGTLRQVITDANNGLCTPAPCTIAFNMPQPRIALGTGDLPALNVPATIDGGTQPGFSGNPIVEIDASGNDGVDILPLDPGAAGSTIRSLSLHGAGGAGLFVQADGVTVRNCWIGVKPDGSISGNGTGIHVVANGITIGGPSPSDRNVIAGNSFEGIYLATSSAATIQGNYIGTGTSGNTAAPNGYAISLYDTTSSQIGGTGSARNIVNGTLTIFGSGGGAALTAASAEAGGTVRAMAFSSDNNVVEGNYFGVALDGSTPLGNSGFGVFINGTATNNQIGTANAGNVISGNGSGGVQIYATGMNYVRNNLIGLDATGNSAVPNGGPGVEVNTPAEIGGLAASQGNRIAHNTGSAVQVIGVAGIGIFGNGTHSNGFGIDFNSNGSPETNDAGDADTGDNNLQNSPAIGSVSKAGTSLTVTVSVDSSLVVPTAPGSLMVEVFKANAGEGEIPLGRACFAGNALSNASLTVPAGTAIVGDTIVATTTSFSDGSCTTTLDGTSEYSTAATIAACTPPSVTVTPGGATTFCTGGSVSLDAGPGFASYNWSNGMTGQVITVSTSGNYSVTVTDGTGCPGTSAPVTVTVNPAPAMPTISAPATVCAASTGHTASVTSNPGSTYNWTASNAVITAGQGSASITFSVGATTPVTLNVIETNANGCTSPAATQNVTVTPTLTPTVSPSGPTTFCAGGSVTLTADPGYTTYLWSNGQSGQSITVNSAGSYSVTVTNASGCTGSSAPVTVTVNPTPSVAITGPTSSCAGSPVTLNATSGFSSYSWHDGTSVVGTGAALNIVPSSTKTYTVTVVDGNGCSAQASQTVAVTALPSSTISAPATVCPGSSGNVASVPVAAGTPTYTWSITNGTITGGQGSPSITFDASATSPVTLGVTVTANGCSSTGSASVALSASLTPTITASGPLTFCSGGSVTLDAGAGYSSYLWSNGASSQAITVTASGSYSVTVSNASGCTGTSSPTVVTVNPAPAVSIAGPATSCSGTPVTLDAGTGFSSYLWSNGATSQQITVTPASTATYSVTVSNGSCSASASKTVTVTTTPVTTISAPATICSSGSATASVPAAAGTTFNWTISGGTITAGLGSNAVTFVAGTSGSVVLNLTATSGSCSSSSSKTIPIGSTPSAGSISGPSSVCPGTTFTLDAGAGYTSYLWTNGSTSRTINVSQTQQSVNYKVTVTNASGCSTTLLKNVTLTSNPSATILTPSSTTAGSNGNIAFVADQAGASYTWAIDGGTITSGQGTHSITFTAGNGASVSLAVVVNIGACSKSGSTIVALSAPAVCPTAAPTLVSPAEGASNLSSPVAFSWNAVSGASSYSVWIIPGSGGPILAGTTSATALSAGVPSGISRWYVTADYAANCPSIASAQREITVLPSGNCATVAPVPIAPATNATVNAPVTFQWSAVPSAIGYRVWASIDGAAFQDVGQTTGAISLQSALLPGNITWFVEAIFAGCGGAASNQVTFNIPRPDPCATVAPTTLISPADNVTLSSAVISFSWNSVFDADGYRVWIKTPSSDAQTLGTTEETSFEGIVPSGPIEWWVESLFDGCPSADSAHRRLTVPAAQSCGNDRPELISPASGSTTDRKVVTFSWTPVSSAIGYELWVGLDNGTPTLRAATRTATTADSEVTEGRLEWFVRALFDGCPARDSQKRQFTFAQPPSCPTGRPLLKLPEEGSTQVVSPADFRWSSVPGAAQYKLWIQSGHGQAQVAATTSSTNASGIAIGEGVSTWWVEAIFNGNCATTLSTERVITVVARPAACSTPAQPLVAAPAEISSGVRYALTWQEVAGATSYLVQESLDASFATSSAKVVNEEQASFTNVNDSAEPLAYHYRVRGIDDSCNPPQQGLFSRVVTLYILPKAAAGGATPAAELQQVTYSLPIGAELAGQSFTATPNQPWLTVTPSSGIVPPGGMSLTVVANTSGLPLGASLGGVTLTTSDPTTTNGLRIGSNGTTVKTTTVSVNLVQPVMPNPKSTPGPDALIIPAVANADGVNAKFQSDVRVTNTSTQVIKYQLTFTPSGDDGLQNGRQSTVDVEPGSTIALDNILQSWFGTGGSNATGTLEIRPLTQTTSSTPNTPLSGIPNLVTFAASRTFNLTANGTFGQYIPAIPYANFVGRATDPSKSTVLTLQQIAQGTDYRTNLGFVEGSGQAASLAVSVFGDNGQKITDFPVELKGGQHLQLNSFLAQRNIQMKDGRVEVRVTSPGGKVTAYASVLDNHTSDPLLVTPVALSDSGATKWVVPGVADLSNGSANWRTDMRLYNASTTPVNATLTFQSQNGGEPKSADVSIAPGEVKQFDGTLARVFGVTNDGGAVHVTTASSTKLIATARTYNQTSGGTYGQFISGVTPGEAVGLSSRPLQLLQVEETDRFRTNIGLAEVSGKPVKVQLTVIPPDSKISAVVDVDLAANQFRQLNSMLRQLNLGETYNARVTVKVIGGEGRVTAYASVIDSVTQDPTFVPAQ